MDTKYDYETSVRWPSFRNYALEPNWAAYTSGLIICIILLLLWMPPSGWIVEALLFAALSFVVPNFVGGLVLWLLGVAAHIPLNIATARRRARAELYRDAYAVISGDFDFSRFHYELTDDEDGFWGDVAAIQSGELLDRFRVDDTVHSKSVQRNAHSDNLDTMPRRNGALICVLIAMSIGLVCLLPMSKRRH